MDQAISAMGYGMWDVGYGIWDMGYVQALEAGILLPVLF